jgi:Tfp pilus assembly protein PilN
MISLQSSLGIQFGRNYLRLVYLKKSLKEVALDAHSLIHFPPDLPAEDMDKYLSQEISGFLQEKNIGKENVWVALPRNEFLIRFITLPLSVEENLRDVIRYELEKYIPFSEEEVYFDFLSLEREVETKKLKVLLLAIKKPVLERYLTILESAAIAPFGLEVSATALSNFFLMGQNGPEEKPVAVVNIERDGFEVHCVDHGMLHYSRATDFNTEKDHAQIAQINHELRNGFRIGFPLQIFGPGEGASAVFLSGDGTKDDLIARFAPTREIPLETFSCDTIYSRLNFSGSFPLSLSAGIGLAFKGIRKVPIDVNLLPTVLRKKINKTGLHLSFYLVIAMLVLTLTWGISSVVKERLQLRKVEKEIEALKPDVLAVQKTQEEAQDSARRIESLNSIQRSEFSKLEIVKELSDILPSSVWITEFHYNKNELDLTGFAASASGLISILDDSPLFHESEFTAPITRDMEGKESFRIKTKIEGK